MRRRERRSRPNDRVALPRNIQAAGSVRSWCVALDDGYKARGDARNVGPWDAVRQGVALTYGVPAWSEKHCELMARSLEWIGKLGGKVLTLPLGVGPCTIHDLRRSCITNWARRLPIHVVQKLAGHSDINTTETYYLSVQSEDLANTRRLQSELVGDILADSGTDPLLTHFRPTLTLKATEVA